MTKDKTFSPAQLGPFSLRNPTVYLPLFTSYAEPEGQVSPQTIAHYTRMAATGVGMVVVESSAIRAPHINPYTIRAFGEEMLPGLRQLADAIHRQGAVAILQICHSGRFASVAGAAAPSAVPVFNKSELMPREMDEQDMEEICHAFAEAADCVRQAGFDGVELHGATGYLLSSFTSPLSNQRHDAYGGPVENRIAFPLRVCRAVRERVGNFPVGYRLMLREYRPGGLAMEDGLFFARALAETLQPAYLSVTAGTHECTAWMAEQKIQLSEGYMLPEAMAVKKILPQTPVIAAGLLQGKERCEHALANRMTDAIGLGRVLFADPDWLRKAQGMISEPIRFCEQCHNCSRQISRQRPAFCSLWRKEEKERNLRDVPVERLRV